MACTCSGCQTKRERDELQKQLDYLHSGDVQATLMVTIARLRQEDSRWPWDTQAGADAEVLQGLMAGE